MQKELADNFRQKGDWDQWHPSPLLLFDEISDHLTKLREAIALGNSDKVKEHAADVANYCMKAVEDFAPPLVRTTETRYIGPDHEDPVLASGDDGKVSLALMEYLHEAKQVESRTITRQILELSKHLQ